MDIFSQRLKEVRRSHALSQQEVAETIGITRSAYSNYEQGLREPDMLTLKKICQQLEISADYLLGLEN